MDALLDVLDTFVFDRLYAAILPDTAARPKAVDSSLLNQHVKLYIPLEPSSWAEASLLKRDHMARQTLSLFLMTWFFGLAMYLLGSFIMYHTVYDKRLLKHPRYLPNQMQQEVKQGLFAIPLMALLTAPLFLAEVRGWSKLYNFASEAPFPGYNWLQYPLFICFTDSGIYWIHRGLHHPLVYRWLHKPHHKWVVPTPFASYAFHPLDGWSQSLPYHIFPFLFPLQKVAYLGLFVFVTVWTLLIHDAEYLSTSEIINGAACHTMHHLYFNYNYGQYITIWDRLGGTYRKPEEDTFMCDANRTGKTADKVD